VPSQMDQRPSRSTFFWFLGSKLKGKAVADLLHIEAARLRKSIELDTVILAWRWLMEGLERMYVEG
jgi:hypothetical protein